MNIFRFTLLKFLILSDFVKFFNLLDNDVLGLFDADKQEPSGNEDKPKFKGRT